MKRKLAKEAVSVLKTFLNKEDSPLQFAAVSTLENIFEQTNKTAKQVIPSLKKIASNKKNCNHNLAIMLLAKIGGKKEKKELFSEAMKMLDSDNVESICMAINSFEYLQVTNSELETVLPIVIKQLENIDPRIGCGEANTWASLVSLCDKLGEKAIKAAPVLIANLGNEYAIRHVEALVHMGTKVLPLLEKELGNKNQIVQNEASKIIDLITKTNEKSVPSNVVSTLIKLLADENSEVVKNAISSLAGERKAVPALTKALETENKDIRAYSALILGKIGQNYSLSKKALTALANALKDKNDQVVSNAKEALEKIGLPSVTPLIDLVGAIDPCDFNTPYLSTVEDILANIGPNAVPILLKVAERKGIGFPFYPFAQAIKKMGIQAMPHLLTALNNENKKIALGVAYVLAYLGEEELLKATPMFVEFLKNKNECQELREYSAFLLFDKNEVKPANSQLTPILIEMLEDECEKVRYHALKGVTNMYKGDFAKMAIQPLISGLKKEKDDYTLSLGLFKLETLLANSEEVVSLLSEISAKNGFVRDNWFPPLLNNVISFAAQYALKYNKEREIKEIFVRNLNHKDPNIRAASIKFLGELGTCTKEEFSLMVSFLNDENEEPGVYWTVMGALENIIKKAYA